MHSLSVTQTQSYLQLNLGLGNILFASAAAGDLLGLGDLGADSVSAEVLERVALDGIDAQDRVGLDDGEASRHYTASQVLVAALFCREKLRRHTEELLAAAAVFNNLDQAGLQLLDGGDVVGEDTHLSGLGGNVDLHDTLRLVDGLLR